MHPILNIAFQAARKAAQQILIGLDRLDRISIVQKQAHDYMTSVDQAAEQEIVNIIRKTYPEHQIITEETGLIPGKEENTWIIDPLDGTHNFIHGYPNFTISIAFLHRGKLQNGLIYDPLRQELFTATRGEGARCNDKRIRVSQQSKFDLAFLGTGLPICYGDELTKMMSLLNQLLPKVADIRISGSAALDLAYVAAGRLDGYWENNIKAWDFAAGALIVQEAGGVTSSFTGQDNFFETGAIIAANLKLHPLLLDFISKHL